MESILLLLLSLAAVIQGASIATKYAEKVAEGFHMSRYIVGFIVVSFISILPETLIAINAALAREPALGIGTLFGSNVIDLTLIFAILVFITKKRGLRIEKGLLSKLLTYPLFLTIPLLLGLDGNYSRSEGISLIIVGIIFYYFVFKKSVGLSSRSADIRHHTLNISTLLIGMVLLLIGAHFTTSSAVALADNLRVEPILIGVMIVSFGTTLPELFFSIKAVQNKKDSLAVGDILGSVLADATIVVGLVATITPFSFPRTIAYTAGGFMVLSSIVLIYFMRTRHRIVRKEATVLLGIWVCYIFAELIANKFSMPIFISLF